MRIRFPKHYTVLIARTGRSPVTLTIHPAPIALGLTALVASPVVWIGSLLHNNSQLSERNEELTDTASEVLSELDSLDAEIDSLKQRAGMDEDAQINPARVQAEVPPRGGLATAVDAETMLGAATRRLPSLEALLKGEVRPALEETLSAEAQREAAFPSGKPIAATASVSSEFGLRPNPFGGRRYEMHEGLDFKGPIGQPIHATASGRIKLAQDGNGYGNHVVIDHGFGYETLYAHLSKMHVEAGDYVKRGDLIGELGNTGRSSGPHLHYGIYRQGQPVNPRYYLKLEDSEG